MIPCPEEDGVLMGRNWDDGGRLPSVFFFGFLPSPKGLSVTKGRRRTGRV